MENKFLLLAAALLMLSASCSNSSGKQEGGGTIQRHSCYVYMANKDSIMLSVNVTGNMVTGELTYALFEKDKNRGTIQGVMKGDTLFADYTFMSEGRESVREIAFVKKGKDLIEGYGEVEEQNGKMVFKDRSALRLNTKIRLKRVSCDEGAFQNVTH